MIRMNSVLLSVAALCVADLAGTAQAAAFANLPVVKPIVSCADLAKADISKVVDKPGVVKSAELVDTDKGPFCKVTAEVEPTITVTVSLPTEHWTQRYIMNGGGGGAPGPNGYIQAGTCMPALNGEFAVSGNNLGHFTPGAARDLSDVKFWEWGQDPQKRIDWGYRANHVTVLVSKALMKAYYGKAPRYSYFIGCSEGGREALIEAQRFPEDFDGISAGAPAALQTSNETTSHLWIVQADRRADGTNILMPDKRKLVHDALLTQCDTLSGVKDGLLQDPNACHFNPASLRCPANVSNTSGCLTAEEVSVVQKIYDGAYDDQGHHLLFGLERGGEAQWNLASTPTIEPPRAQLAAYQKAFVIFPEVTPALADFNKPIVFTKADFEMGETLAPLYNGTNTNLKPFAARGGKLILWHGLTDFLIPPKVTLAYYRGVQKFMGEKAADEVTRLFLIPGVGHCGGGDGYNQLDVLSPLMSWVESKQAPTEILTGKIAQRAGATNGNALQPTGPRPSKPYATPMPTLTATRPVYPYPFIARYTGNGDPNVAANYARAKSPVTPAQEFAFDYEAFKLIGPNSQHDYGVRDGRLVVVK